jgi:anti-anti-sigma factor
MLIRAVVVTLSGDVDLSSVPQLADRLDAVRDEPFVIIDLREVSYLDSIGITHLMRAHARAELAGGAIALVSSGERIARVLSVAGITMMTRLFETPELASEYLAQLSR